MSRILITGGSGLLAVNWACCMRDAHEIVLGCHKRLVDLKGTRCRMLDLEDIGVLARSMDSIAPDFVVHTAGLTDVELCEREPALATHANANLAGNVAAACAKSGIKLVHISTDHIFAGTRASLSETDIPAPLNAYAASKLRGEENVAAANPQALIVRTNFFGWGHRLRHSFSDWIIGSLRAGNAIDAFDDVYFTPILADRLAKLAHALVMQEAHGVINVCGNERISKFEFASQLAARFGLPSTLIRRAKMADRKTAVLRPHDMSLNNAKLRSALGQDAGGTGEQLLELANQEREGRPAELQNAVKE